MFKSNNISYDNELTVILEYCPSAENVSDIFTKALPKHALHHLMQKMRIAEDSEIFKLESDRRKQIESGITGLHSRGSTTNESADHIELLLPRLKLIMAEALTAVHQARPITL